jgi:hypothetical protein
MRMRRLFPAAILAVPLYSGPVPGKLPTALPNPKTTPAGTLRGHVLRIELEARLAMWHPDGDSLTGIAVETFAERGKRPQVPGPRPGAPRYRDPGISAQLTRARHPHLPFSRGASSITPDKFVGPDDGRKVESMHLDRSRAGQY